MRGTREQQEFSGFDLQFAPETLPMVNVAAPGRREPQIGVNCNAVPAWPLEWVTMLAKQPPGRRMPNDHARKVSLTAELSDFIRAHVALARCRKSSEIVRSGAAACERRQAAAKRTTQRKASYARSA
jgi:hypothetical protein